MGIKIIVRNKRASFDYQLLEKYEAGLSLVGTEVKVLRLGKASIHEANVAIDAEGEAWIYNMTIPHYEFGNVNNHQETRKRKLLLHKKEIVELFDGVRAQGMTIVPVSLYFKEGNVKLEIALAKGKKLHDKRQDEAKKDIERKLRRGDY